MFDIWKKIKKYGHPVLIYYIIGMILYRVFNYVNYQDTVEVSTFLTVSLFSLTEIFLAITVWISIEHAKNREPKKERPISLNEKYAYYINNEKYRMIAVMCLDDLTTFELRQEYESWQAKHQRVREKNHRPFSDLLRELETKGVIQYSNDTGKWSLDSQVFNYLIKYYPRQKNYDTHSNKTVKLKIPELKLDDGVIEDDVNDNTDVIEIDEVKDIDDNDEITDIDDKVDDGTDIDEVDDGNDKVEEVNDIGEVDEIGDDSLVAELEEAENKDPDDTDSEVKDKNILYRVITNYQTSYKKGIQRFGLWWKVLQASIWSIVLIFLVTVVILFVFFLPQIESI